MKVPPPLDALSLPATAFSTSLSERVLCLGAIPAALLALYFSHAYSYLLFHSLIEITSVAIALTLFILAWNTRCFLRSGFFDLVGIGYGAIAVIDLVHTLGYQGMNIFPGSGANLSTQLWIAARYLQAVTLLAASAYVERRPNRAMVFSAYALAVSALLWAVFSGGFPLCYREGVGLTPFKTSSEYVIVGLLLVALWSVWRQEAHFQPRVRSLVLLSIAFTAAAELSFSHYVSVFGLANVIGHLLKLVAFFFIYRAILVTGIQEPFALVVRDLQRTNQELQAVNEELEARNREFRQVNAELQNRETLLRDANLKTEEASRAKSDFLANMSHELRTPLNSVIGFADILDQGLLGELTREQGECVQDIRDSGRHLLSLINDILDLSKVEAGKMELEPEEVDVGKLVQEAVSLFKESALKHRIILSDELGEGTGVIIADARKLKQVMLNLLSNAVKFTAEGGSIRVRARRVEASPSPCPLPQGAWDEGAGISPCGAFVEVAVEDTGIGIAPEDQKKLFQPFHQVHMVLTKECAGTGLGLSLCKSFVELHGGTIGVASTPGRGSTFTFRLPVDHLAKREPPLRPSGAALPALQEKGVA